MATATEVAVRMTLGQFAELPETKDQGFKLELIDGEVVEVPMPAFQHGEVVIVTGAAITPYVNERKLGRVSGDAFVLFDPEDEDSFSPDLIFVAREHLHLIRDGRVWGAPDLVIEVLSPSNWRDDYGRKFMAYQQAGIPWYWIIDPETLRIEEYRNTPDGYLRTQTILHGQEFRPGVFPGLVLNLAMLLM